MKINILLLAVLTIVSAAACDDAGLDYIPNEDYYNPNTETSGDRNQALDYADEVARRVSVKSWIPDGYTINLEINSTLPDILKGVTAKYGVRKYIYCERCKAYDDAKDYSFNLMNETTKYYQFDNFLYELDTDYAMYYRIYNTISDKIAAGKELTETEKGMYKQVKEEISGIIEKFRYDIYVEIYGVKYPVKGYWYEDVEPRN